MPYIDTHCHLDQIIEKLGVADYAELKRRHFAPGLEACITISCDPESVEPTLALLENDGVYGAFGIHPHEAARFTPEVESRVIAALAHPKCVAYGEIGLDYHYDHSPRDVQGDVFVKQLRIGTGAGKPLVIHTREADADTLAILREHAPRDWPIHVHCFTSSRVLAESLLADFPNLCLGFTGIVTFRNAEALREVVRLTPLDRMLVETDGPWLAPAPHRGRIAHPGHIPLILEKIAEIKGTTAEEVAAATTANAKRMYGLS
jgi:TatD DNase family protein